MKLLFFNSQRSSVGIDVGTHQIKLVELACRDQQVRLVKLASMPVFQEAVQEDKAVQRGKILDALKYLVGKAEIRTPKVIVAVDGRSVSLRKVTLPSLSEKDLKEVAKWEAVKYLSCDKNEVIVDFLPTLPNKNRRIKRQEGFLVTVPRLLVENYYELFIEAGLEPLAVEIQPLALWRALAKAREDGLACIDLGANNTNVAIFHQGSLSFAKVIPWGGNRVTRAIAQAEEMDFLTAQHRKETMEDTLTVSSFWENNAINMAFSELRDEIRRCFSTAEVQSKINRIILSGGTSCLKGLPEYLTKELDIPVETGDPFASFEISGYEKKELAAIAPGFAVAVGLALREVKGWHQK